MPSPRPDAKRGRARNRGLTAVVLALRGLVLDRDANLWFTEASPPGRIGKVGAGCVPPPTPPPTPAIPLTTESRFTG